MRAALPCLVLFTAACPALAAEPAPAPQPRFEGLFVDWRDASRESVEAERRAAALAPTGAAAVPGTVPGSAALGQRVGEIVALGDCAEGERVARAAGDFALVAAVRDHCRPRLRDAR